MIMDTRRAAAVFRDCYLRALFIYDGFIMLSPSWITLSQAQYGTTLHTLLYATAKVKHTAVFGKPEQRFIVVSQTKWKRS